MKKTILITGSTDGIGLATAKSLITHGHHVLIHGRNPIKLDAIKQQFESKLTHFYQADLSSLNQTKAFSEQIIDEHQHLDVLINNAGVYVVPEKKTEDGFDVRFAVNAISPYLLTQKLLPILDSDSRIINLSSAAQASLDVSDLISLKNESDDLVYAKSKLAITMWTRHLAKQLTNKGPIVVAVNPASLLGSKMVQDAYGIAGGDVQIGANILFKAALSDEFSNSSGLYFDNDKGEFLSPHADALDTEKVTKITLELDRLIDGYL